MKNERRRRKLSPQRSWIFSWIFSSWESFAYVIAALIYITNHIIVNTMEYTVVENMDLTFFRELAFNNRSRSLVVGSRKSRKRGCMQHSN